MQYQCCFCSSQGVRIRPCAKGTHSPSAAPSRDGGETRGRCATMEKQNKMADSAELEWAERALSSRLTTRALVSATNDWDTTLSRRKPRSRAQARSVFSLLSSLLSLLPSPCRRSLATPRSQESSHLLDSISSLLSLLSSLFPLLCVLASLCSLLSSVFPLLSSLFSLLSFIFFLLSSIFSLLSTNPAVRQFGHFRRFFFLISSPFSLLAPPAASRPGKVRTLLQYSCTIDGAPHCFVPWRHPDPHPDVFFSSKCIRFYLCSFS